ncbi:uncharacterized protein LOC143029579 isoform X2 [Oratosquilla oratoria]
MTRLTIGTKDVVIVRVETSWPQAYDLCESLGMKMIYFDSEVTMYQTVKLIKSQGLTAKSFWVGGHNRFGSWRWVNNDLMPMGSPYWGLSYDKKHQEPYEGNPSLHPSNYACMWGGKKYHFLHSCWNDTRIYSICRSV